MLDLTLEQRVALSYALDALALEAERATIRGLTLAAELVNVQRTVIVDMLALDDRCDSNYGPDAREVEK